jgi:hypothetical protein
MLGKNSKSYIKINRARIKGREEASKIYKEEIENLKSEIKNKVKKDTDDFYISIKRTVSESIKREAVLQDRFNEVLALKDIQFKSAIKEIENSNNILIESLKKSLKTKEDEYVKKIEILDSIIKENEQLNQKLKKMIQDFSHIVNLRDIKLVSVLKQISVLLHEDKESLISMSDKYSKLETFASQVKRLTIN